MNLQLMITVTFGGRLGGWPTSHECKHLRVKGKQASQVWLSARLIVVERRDNRPFFGQLDRHIPPQVPLPVDDQHREPSDMPTNRHPQTPEGGDEEGSEPMCLVPVRTAVCFWL